MTDKRSVYFKDSRSSGAFGGSGQTLGGETRPSRLVPSNLDHGVGQYDKNNGASQSDKNRYNATEETSELPGPKMTMDQFLKKLPNNVVKNGKIIDIRESVGDQLHVSLYRLKVLSSILGL